MFPVFLWDAGTIDQLGLEISVCGTYINVFVSVLGCLSVTIDFIQGTDLGVLSM